MLKKYEATDFQLTNLPTYQSTNLLHPYMNRNRAEHQLLEAHQT